MMMNLFLPSWLLCEIVVKVSSSFGRGAGLLWLLCFSQYFSHGFYTSRTPSISCYEFVSVLNWTPNINPCFCLCVLCASVSVSCVFLSLCLVCFCLETAAAVERDAMDWTAGYGWLWLVMRFYLVLGTEFELSVAVQKGTGRYGPCSFLDGDSPGPKFVREGTKFRFVIIIS